MRSHSWVVPPVHAIQSSASHSQLQQLLFQPQTQFTTWQIHNDIIMKTTAVEIRPRPHDLWLKLKATSLPTSAYHAKSRIHHKSWSDSQVNQLQSVMGPTSTPSLIEILLIITWYFILSVWTCTSFSVCYFLSWLQSCKINYTVSQKRTNFEMWNTADERRNKHNVLALQPSTEAIKVMTQPRSE